jgi:hypothetical protein
MAVVSRRKSNRQDRRTRVASVNAGLLRRSLEWVLDDSLFGGIAFHGNVSWRASHLVALAVLWVWSDHATLTGAFAQAVSIARAMGGSVALTTYQGLTKALRRWTEDLLPVLQARLHMRMEHCGDAHWRFGRWLPLAVDGSRISTPRTVGNERAFAAQNYGRGQTARSRKSWKNKRRRTQRLGQPVRPQIWVTLLWHMGLKMPWAWKTGPSTSSERTHFATMLREPVFPENTLFCGDAGFVGYELWTAILQAGHHFAIRVGANVRLLRGLGRVRHGREMVSVWPKDAERRGQPPVHLRLLELRGPRGPVCIATSVLSEADLPASDVGRLYRLRWGIELQFRSFKQTFGRRYLRSRNPDCATVELDWSLVGLWMVQLLAVKEQVGMEIAPEQCSVALVVALVRDLMREAASPGSPRQYRQRLSRAVHDAYRRRGSKRGRYRSAIKDPPSAQQPKITIATHRQREAFRKLETAAA